MAQVVRESFGDFDIRKPILGEILTLSPTNDVQIVVDDAGGHDQFRAATYEECNTTSPPTWDQCRDLTKDPMSDTWFGDIPVAFLDPFDIFEINKQVIVHARKGIDTVAKVARFCICQGLGSGSGSGSGVGSPSGSQGRCEFCSTLVPVPATLSLANPTSVTNGTCGNCASINRVTNLYHSNDDCLDCSWFSGAVDFCGSAQNQLGYWKLQKVSATNWTLSFRQVKPQNPTVIATYLLAKTANDCTFPITLQLDSNNDHCQNWPASVTISAG